MFHAGLGNVIRDATTCISSLMGTEHIASLTFGLMLQQHIINHLSEAKINTLTECLKSMSLITLCLHYHGLDHLMHNETFLQAFRRLIFDVMRTFSAAVPGVFYEWVLTVYKNMINFKPSDEFIKADQFFGEDGSKIEE